LNGNDKKLPIIYSITYNINKSKALNTNKNKRRRSLIFLVECHQKILFNREIIFFFFRGDWGEEYLSSIEESVNFLPLSLLPSLIKKIFIISRVRGNYKNNIGIKDKNKK
jgi:hypothetical protein